MLESKIVDSCQEVDWTRHAFAAQPRPQHGNAGEVGELSTDGENNDKSQYIDRGIDQKLLKC